MIRTLVRWLLTLLYKVRIHGLEHFEGAGDRVLIVANHASFLDPVLLWAFLPEDVTFAINTQIAEQFWVKPALRFARVFPMDPAQPMSVKAVTHHLRQNRRAVLFPEGRITTTGALMKIYDGAGMIADKADAEVLPVRIDGAQYTPFSRMRGILRLRWFPTIAIHVMPPRKLAVPREVRGDERRQRLGIQLEDLMSEMVCASGNIRRTLFSAVVDARRIHGGRRQVLEDMQRKPLSYDGLITQSLAIGRMLADITAAGENVGVMLPSACSTVATFLGLQEVGRVPAMLNYGAGARTMLAACRIACVKTVVSSRRFVELAKLEREVEQLAAQVRVTYLEDLVSGMSWQDKVTTGWLGLKTRYVGSRSGDPHEPAVILFTSGSEGDPKGVALSHANLLSNRDQFLARIDASANDRVLNVLPLFHSFGLAVGTLLPVLSGMRCFLYPSPLHYRVIPEIAYDTNATLLFGTNTFLSGYARHAHPYDFYSMRYVFAGAEKLREETRKVWSDKFGIRILEGYGVTETSPVLAVNTPMHFRAGSVGRLVPGIEAKLEPVPGVNQGGRLHVRGPNVMLGYLLTDHPGRISPPVSCFGEGWHDTGDLADIDAEGYLSILGRVKRFAKVGGEMVSLAAVEELAGRLWPEALHAAVAVDDAKKGEQVVLVTDRAKADRSQLVEHARREGVSELYLPRLVHVTEAMPILATGKLDYRGIARLVDALTIGAAAGSRSVPVV